MKAIKLIIFGIMLILAGSIQGQLSVRLNFGTPPAWGPEGYNDARYYYLPDVEAYYDVRNSMFIYISGNRWVHRTYLPTRYRNYDLYGGYKVVINDYRGNPPFYHFREHRMKYARGYRGHDQRNIGERGNGREQHSDYRSTQNPERHDNRDQGRRLERGQNRVNGNREQHGNGRNRREGREHDD